MTFYSRMKTLSDRQILSKGSALTIRAKDTAGDPVTGAAASDGATRSVLGVVAGIDNKTFPETIVEAGDRMLLLEADGAVEVGEKWIDGSDEWAIVSVVQIKPDNATSLLFKALVRG